MHNAYVRIWSNVRLLEVPPTTSNIFTPVTVNLDYNCDLWTCPREYQDEPACQISWSKVVYFKSYCPDI